MEVDKEDNVEVDGMDVDLDVMMTLMRMSRKVKQNSRSMILSMNHSFLKFLKNKV
jgi:hypothetical protein